VAKGDMNKKRLRAVGIDNVNTFLKIIKNRGGHIIFIQKCVIRM